MKEQLKLSLLIAYFLLFCINGASGQAEIRVACVGNSITEGSGLKKTYPQVLQELMGEDYDVRNFGLGGRTLLKKGDRPYWNEAKYQEVLAWKPDIVIIKLGTNDTKPQNWMFKEDFVKDYKALVKSFKKLSSKPTVYICSPIPVFEEKWGINEVALNEVIRDIKKIARKSNVELIDLYTPFVGQGHLTYDGIHPNDEGAARLAAEVYNAIKEKATVSAK